MEPEKLPYGVEWIMLKLTRMKGGEIVITDRSDNFLGYVDKVNVPDGYSSVEIIHEPTLPFSVRG